MIYGYSRVSTKCQAKDGNSLAAQERQLKDAGAEIVFSDAFTGTKTERPELQKMLQALKDGDKLIVCKLDRIARSATQGFELVEKLLQKGVTVNILNMGMMDNSPTGKLIRHIMFAFAEFERDMIVTRTQEGKAIAKQREGFRDGRPPKYSDDQIKYALQLLESQSYNKVEKITGISRTALLRAKRRQRASEF